MKVHTQKQSQQQVSTSVASTRPTSQSSSVHPLIDFQRTIGNQAVQRMLQTNAKGPNAPAQLQAEAEDDPTVNPSPRALQLLKELNDAKKDNRNICNFSGSEFIREAGDTDAVTESIRVKNEVEEDSQVGAMWTYEFVENKRTGHIFVRESQDGTEIVNYYVIWPNLTEPTTADLFNQITSTDIFKQASKDFDFGSAKFLKFYSELDEKLPLLPDISHTGLVITFGGKKNSLNEQRAETLKDDLIKRGVKGMNISVEFGEQEASPFIRIQTSGLLPNEVKVEKFKPPCR